MTPAQPDALPAVTDAETSLWFARALLPGGWASGVRVSIHSGEIIAVDTDTQRAPGEGGGDIGLPGMPNLHSHAFQRGMAGLTEISGGPGDDFWAWRELMYRFLDRADPDDIEAITAYAFAEMLEGGFTRVAEFHYLHNDPAGAAYTDPSELTQRIAAASQSTGIGLTLLPVFYAHATFGGAPPSHGQRRFVLSVDDFARLVDAGRGVTASMPDAVVGVAPHSLRAVTPDELQAVIAIGRNGPKHIHAAEQQKEVDDCLAWSGARPVEWLGANVPLGPDWCLIHATQTTSAEVTLMAKTSAVAGLCPVTEANLGDGIFDAVDFIGQGGVFGLGTDSNVEIGVGAELRALEYSQRLKRRGRNQLAQGKGASTGGSLYQRALLGGGQACGIATGLVAGAPADCISLAISQPFPGQDDQWLDSWIFGGRTTGVHDVWRRGRKVVASGRHIHRDAIEQRYRRAMQRVVA